MQLVELGDYSLDHQLDKVCLQKYIYKAIINIVVPQGDAGNNFLLISGHLTPGPKMYLLIASQQLLLESAIE